MSFFSRAPLAWTKLFLVTLSTGAFVLDSRKCSPWCCDAAVSSPGWDAQFLDSQEGWNICQTHGMVQITTDVTAEQKSSETSGAHVLCVDEPCLTWLLITMWLFRCFCAALTWVKNIISRIILTLSNVSP